MVGGIIQKRNGTGRYNVKGKSSSSSSSFGTIITSDALRPTDVLCGRNKAALSSSGNRTFRVSLALYIPRYEAACTKFQKSAVILYICNVFRHDVGVRFLKKYQDKDNYYYMELNEKEIKKKVGHALRDMSVARRQLLNEKQRLGGVLTKTTTTLTTTTTTTTAIATTVPNTMTTAFRPTKQIRQRDNDANNPSNSNTPININNEEGRTKLLKLITFDDDTIIVNDDEVENETSVLNHGRRDDLGESLQEFLPFVEYDYCSSHNNNNNNNNINNINPEDNNMELLEPIPIHETTTTLVSSSSSTTTTIPLQSLSLSSSSLLYLQQQQSPPDTHYYDQSSSSVVAGDMVRMMMVEEEDKHPDTVTSINNKRRVFNIHEITQEQELLRGISCI